MSDGYVIVPSKGDGYVELARTKSGRLFRKHILNKGDLIHPKTGKKVKIDDTFVEKLKKNFDDGVCDIVQVPLANDNNQHTEDPTRNIGEVVGVEAKDDKVYVVVDVRDEKHAEKMGKTYLGASAYMHLDYTDTRTGKKVGPTLLHSCVTNRPYVTGLENYEEIVKETVAATSDNTTEAVVLLTDDEPVEVTPQATEENTDMPEDKTAEAPKATLEELLTALKSDHGIDVQALQSKATDNEAAAKLTQTLVDALSGAGVKLSNDDEAVSTEDVTGAVAELALTNKTLTDRVNKLERQDAEHVVDGLIGEGRILPAKRKTYVEMALTNRALFDEIVPDEPLVKLNNETGTTPPDDSAHRKNIDDDIKRYVELSASLQ